MQKNEHSAVRDETIWAALNKDGEVRYLVAKYNFVAKFYYRQALLSEVRVLNIRPSDMRRGTFSELAGEGLTSLSYCYQRAREQFARGIRGNAEGALGDDYSPIPRGPMLSALVRRLHVLSAVSDLGSASVSDISKSDFSPMPYHTAVRVVPKLREEGLLIARPDQRGYYTLTYAGEAALKDLALRYLQSPTPQGKG